MKTLLKNPVAKTGIITVIVGLVMVVTTALYVALPASATGENEFTPFNTCGTHTDCPTDMACVANACVLLPNTCTPGVHAECPGDLVCSTAGTCVGCDVGTNQGCGAGETCNATADGLGECAGNACRDYTDCPPNWGCEAGACVPLPNTCTPGVHTECPGTLLCSTAGKCLACMVGTDEGCDASENCRSTVDGLGVCLAKSCTVNADCNSWVSWECQLGLCVPSSSCHMDSQCPIGWGCVVGACVSLNTCTLAAIPGVTAPVRGAIPKTTITETSQYTGTIARSPVPGASFAASTIYTATITLTPKAGFTLFGVGTNFFTVAGATATNAADSGVITAVFPATGTPPASSGGWGGGSSASRDICPDGDFSSSYYDWVCGDIPPSEGGQGGSNVLPSENELETWTNAQSTSPTPPYEGGQSEVQLAYEWAFSHNITTISPLEKANPEGPTLRGHLAKMVTNYVLEVLGRELPEEVPTSCQWKDKASTRESEEIKEYAVKACSLGLMGLGTDYFQPNVTVSRAQFGTVLSRILRQDTYEGGTPYYAQHLQALKDNGIMTQIDNPESRVELRQWIWVMLMRSGEV